MTKNLTRDSDRHSHYTRHAANFILPVHRLALLDETFSYIGAKRLNMLPGDIKYQGGRITLSTRLRSFLTGEPSQMQPYGQLFENLFLF